MIGTFMAGQLSFSVAGARLATKRTGILHIAGAVCTGRQGNQKAFAPVQLPQQADFRRSICDFCTRCSRHVLDFIFPPLCAACRTRVSSAHNLCAACWGRIGFLSEPLCTICGFPFEFDAGPETLCAACRQRLPAFDRAKALLRYDEASRDPILAFKRADRLDLVPAFARWMLGAGRELIADADVIVPVPLHRWRLWQRRFNQSALIALTLGKLTGKPVDCFTLVRTRATPSQGDMPSASARRRNVQGAFRVVSGRAGQLRGKSVLLVDDVFTTGSTVDACARALKHAGAARVLVLTLARVVRPVTKPI